MEEGLRGERWGKVESRNVYKGPMDKNNVGKIECGKWGVGRAGRVIREK